MRYYKEREYEPEYGEGFVYSEVDEGLDLVVRQAEVFQRASFFGKWTGSALEGWISDKKASQLGFTEDKAISGDEFEVAWKQANSNTDHA